jgi:hypothetical protein
MPAEPCLNAFRFRAGRAVFAALYGSLRKFNPTSKAQTQSKGSLSSLDHPICPRQDVRWDREADLLCGF